MTYNNNEVAQQIVTITEADIVQVDREKIAKEFQTEEFQKKYPTIFNVCTILEKPRAEIIGRDMKDLKDGLRNPEKPNVILLGEPGSGKTAYVQGFAESYEGSVYLILVVNIEKFMIDARGNKDSQIANGLVDLVNEVKRYSEEHDILIGLFIDEFHSIIEFSNAAVQKLKPILEEAQRYGFRIIAATTFEEYDKFIAGDKALDQRFNRINLAELHRDVVVKILQARAKKHGVAHLCAPNIFTDVYNVSKQVEPSKSQPRASVDIFNNIIGNVTKMEIMQKGKIHRLFYKPHELGIIDEYVISRQTLNKVIRRSYNIDIDNEVSLSDVKNALYGGLLGQDTAINEVIDGVKIIIAGFTDTTRPKMSFLSTGSTGVGKTEMAKLLSEALHIPLRRFDMSRFSDPQHATEFADQLALAAWSNPNAYILIDEIEKASREVVNILLQVLDDARLAMANNPNRIASFTGTIINLTTNVGSEIYQDFKSFSSNGILNTDVIYKSLVNSPKFETAVLGRIDSIVPFMPLSDDIMGLITKKYLTDNISMKTTLEREFYVSGDVYKYIVQDKTSRDTEFGGARDAKRQTRKHVLSKIANELCEYPNDESPLAVYVTGDPRFNNLKQGDANAGDIGVSRCHPIALVKTYIKAIEQKLGRKITDKGLYVPISVDMKDFARTISACVNSGLTELRTYAYLDKFLIQATDELFYTIEDCKPYNKHLLNQARINAQKEKERLANDKKLQENIDKIMKGEDLSNKKDKNLKNDVDSALKELASNK